MDISERIATIVKVNQHTAASFADAIGVQRSSLSHILNGRNKPSLDFLQKVLTHFPRVDAGWLITGKHPVKPKSELIHPEEEESVESQVVESEGVEFDNAAQHRKEKSIERIVVFYTDRTFDTYDAS